MMILISITKKNMFRLSIPRSMTEVSAMGTKPAAAPRSASRSRISRYSTMNAIRTVAVSILPIGGRIRRSGMTSGDVRRKTPWATGFLKSARNTGSQNLSSNSSR